MKKFITAAVIATLAISSSASAAVSFDAVLGTGFAGKGDVQLAFGWNNAALQRNAKDLTFGFEETERYDVECEWYTGGNTNPQGKVTARKLHEVVKKVKLNSSIAVSFDPRTRNQITGFNLNGRRADTAGGAAPNIGESCHGLGTEGTVSEVIYVGTTASDLQVTYGGDTRDLPNTPVVLPAV
jgi:hypothetical protein